MKMKLKVKLDDGAFMPLKAHESDAGYDIMTPVDFDLRKKAEIDTGVHIMIPNGYVGMLKAKSGLNVNFDIVGEGVIDAGYTGSIKVKLYDLDYCSMPHHFDRGDKIIQIVIIPVPDTETELVDELEETERGDNGFGSTGK